MKPAWALIYAKYCFFTVLRLFWVGLCTIVGPLSGPLPSELPSALIVEANVAVALALNAMLYFLCVHVCI